MYQDFLAIPELDSATTRFTPPSYDRKKAEGNGVKVEASTKNSISATLAPSLPLDPHFVPSSMPRLCVERHSPLVCPNHELVMQLAMIRKARDMDGDERGSLSYSRAIAVCTVLIATNAY